MKKIFIFCNVILLFILFGCGDNKNKDEAVIKLKILNSNQDFITTKEKYNSTAKTDTVKINKEGLFEIRLKTDTLTSFELSFRADTLSDRMNGHQKDFNDIDELSLLLDREYNLEISFDAEDVKNSLKITGTGSELNNFAVRKSLYNQDANAEYAKAINSNIRSFQKFTGDYKAEIQKLIDAYLSDASKIPPGFKNDEEKNLTYNFYNMKINYARKHMLSDSTDANKMNNDYNYFNFMKDVPFDKIEELSNPIYMRLINSYIDFLIYESKILYPPDSEDVRLKKFKSLKTIFRTQDTKDIVLYEYLKKNISAFNQKWYQIALEDYFKSSKSVSMKDELIKMGNAQGKLSSKIRSPDFTYPDIHGVKHSLSDFKGKYVYINLWATWCLPYLTELPHLKSLEEDYKRRNIVFLSVSIDENAEQWKKYVAENKPTGIQLIASETESGFNKEYRSKGIPRYILISQEGEILDDNAPRPSSPEIREQIDALPGL